MFNMLRLFASPSGKIHGAIKPNLQAVGALGLMAVEEELQGEILELAGERYSRGGQIKRWGQNPDSVFVSEQKLKVNVPRLRDMLLGKEVSLKSYERLQSPSQVDEVAFRRVVNGISNGKYDQAAESVPETFGISRSSVSRKFIGASAKRLEEFLSRDISKYDIVAVFIDGKHFQEHEIVTALGVAITGEKILLGFIETSTETTRYARNSFLASRSEASRLARKCYSSSMGEKAFARVLRMPQERRPW